jgi:rod shape-determining protein MreD
VIDALLGARMRVALLIVVAAIIQPPLLDRLQVSRAHPDLLLLIPVLAGLLGGPEDGAWVGFGAGLFADLSLPTAFGLSALVFCLTGYVVGSIVQALIEGPRWVVPLTAAVGTAIGELLYVGVSFITGQEAVLHEPKAIIAIVVIASAGNAILSFPVALALRWALGPDDRVPA